MRKMVWGFLLVGVSLNLISCGMTGRGNSGLFPSGSSQALPGAMPVGPPIGLKSMDAEDRNKMSQALDKGLGKASEWGNPSTGITYIVTPIEKLTVGANLYCRTYKVNMTKNGVSNEIMGTACVSNVDSSWQVIN